MRALDLDLFLWLTAGPEPASWQLSLMIALAVHGSWCCAGFVGWTAWRRPRERGYVAAVLAAAAVAAVLAHWIAAKLNLPRPFMLGLSPLYIPHGARGSLPSAHAAVMFTVALAFLLRPGLRSPGAVLFVLAAATGWARVHAGVHFPIDIAAGLLLASVVVGAFTAIHRHCVRHFAPGAPQAKHEGELLPATRLVETP